MKPARYFDHLIKSIFQGTQMLIGHSRAHIFIIWLIFQQIRVEDKRPNLVALESLMRQVQPETRFQ
jgi:uncharacterized iron-regulated protein